MKQQTECYVLIACEESQTVCAEFRKLGFNAFSCDLQNCSGGHPEWHILGDAVAAMGGTGMLEDGTALDVPKWDLMIAHPPCTFLTVTGARWLYHPDDKDLPVYKKRPHPLYPNRRQDQEDAIDFFMKFAKSPIDKIAIENPVGVISSAWRSPDQIVHPWQFGDEAEKTTCLWLKNLPDLVPSKIVGKGEFVEFVKKGTGRISRMPKWYSDALSLPPDERQKVRSKTFGGIAKAMASQWGDVLTGKTAIQRQTDLFEGLENGR